MRKLSLGYLYVGSFLDDAKHFSNEPWYEHSLQKILAVDEEGAIKFYREYKKYSWAFRLLETSIYIKPDLAFRYIRTFYPHLDEEQKRIIMRDLSALSSMFIRYWFLQETKNGELKGFIKPDLLNLINKSINKDMLELEVAYLAQDRQPRFDETDFRKLEPILDKVDDSSVFKAIEHYGIEKMKKSDWDIIEERVMVQHTTTDTPGFNLKMQLLHEFSDKHGGVNPIAFAQVKILIARHLVNTQITNPLPADIEMATKEIINKFDSVKNIPLSGNMVLIAHSEMRYGKRRFGTKGLVKALEDKAGANKFVEMRPEDANGNVTIDSLGVAKIRTLNLLSEKIYTKDSYTIFFFDGHGGKDAFYLSDGQAIGLQQKDKSKPEVIESTKTIKITAEEFAQAIKNRYDNFGKEAIEKTVLVFSACFQADMIGKIAKILKKEGTPMPIAITASEFDQYGYSDYDNIYGSKFGELFVKSETVGDFIVKSFGGKTMPDANPSVFVPSNTSVNKFGVLQIAGTGYAMKIKHDRV